MTLTPETLPLQRDLFTGQLVDNRSPHRKRLDAEQCRPQQMTLISLKETVQPGISARPWLKNLPRPKLELVREDIRTEEEKERDLMREAEALTGSLFGAMLADLTAEYKEVEAITDESADPDDELTEDNDVMIDAAAPEKVEASKPDMYANLVQIVKECATTVWIDANYRQRFYNQLPQTILEAQAAGLTVAEIAAALQEGDLAGKQETQTASILSNGMTQPKTTKIEGHRRRARRAKIRVRSRVL